MSTVRLATNTLWESRSSRKHRKIELGVRSQIIKDSYTMKSSFNGQPSRTFQQENDTQIYGLGQADYFADCETALL